MANDEVVVYTAQGEEYEKSSESIAPYIVLPGVLLLILIATGMAIHHDAYASGRQDGLKEGRASLTDSGITTGTLTITGGSTVIEIPSRQNQWEHRPHLAAPADAPPAEIKVGPYTYRVRYTSKKALDSINALACTVLEDREIWLNPNRTANLRDDLLHELMHTAHDIGTGGGRLEGSSFYGSEELEIESMSTGLLGIMRDNPELVSWLNK